MTTRRRSRRWNSARSGQIPDEADINDGCSPTAVEIVNLSTKCGGGHFGLPPRVNLDLHREIPVVVAPNKRHDGPVSASLAHVEQVLVPSTCVMSTIEVLQAFGRRGCEGLVLWVGNVIAPQAEIVDIIVPPQRSIRGESGVGYFLENQTLFELNRFLHSHQLRLIAQIHSHPGEAYHSDTDDEFAIVTTEGGFSLVVPDFGNALPDPRAWAAYRLIDRTWEQLSVEALYAMFFIV